MKLKTVPPGRGALWVAAGFRIFLRQPLAFSTLFAVVGFAALLLLQIPLLGPVLVLALMPVTSLEFMIATRAALDGQVAAPALLLAPWRDPLQRRRLLGLGISYAVAVMLASLLVQQFDGEGFDAAMESLAEGRATPESLRESGLLLGMLLRMAALSLLSLVFWHTPALVSWGGMSLSKAVFASVVACARSLGAFTVLGLTWFAVMLGFVLLIQGFFALLGHPAAAAQALLPAGLMFSTVFYASLYFTFADSFRLDDDPAAAPPQAPTAP